MIILAKEDWLSRNTNSNNVPLPLIRLRLIQCDKKINDHFNVIKFGQKYHDKVANLRDILLIAKKRGNIL